MPKPTLPGKLYKYRAFNVNTLSMITELEVFYADPRTFNDPFDCDLKFEFDRSHPIDEVETIWHMIMSAHRSQKWVERANRNHIHMATEHGGHYQDDGDGTQIYKDLLLRDIESQLLEDLGSRGVLSLASTWDCPLMWSHYADEHRGLCIEYATKDHRCDRLGPVDYNASRNISLEDIVNWKLHGSVAARTKIVDAYFFAKQRQWKYEKEWRDISQSEGMRPQPFKRITAIHFGYRCPKPVVAAVMGVLDHHGDAIKYYGMDTTTDGFGLNRRAMSKLGHDEEPDYEPRTESFAFVFDRLDPYTDEELFR